RSILPILALMAVVILGGVSLYLRVHSPSASTEINLAASAWLIIGIVIIAIVGRAAFAPGKITYHRVIGAILLYIAVGVVFVALYTLIGAQDAKTFAGLKVKDRDSLLSDMIYFSFVTLTTTGYGDIAPVHPIARALCNVESIIGQLYPATL